MFTLNLKGKIVAFDQPVIMGIINATPDSFYEGHLSKPIDAVLAMAGSMIAAGSQILDIGGQSSRPGSERIPAAEESGRVLPVIRAIHARYPETILSVDTYHSAVARAAIEAGASIVNDISAGEMDSQMLATVGRLRCPYICMHMKGQPENMQEQPVYHDLVGELLDYFAQKIQQCREAGIYDIIIDPGFGFGKTIRHNFELLSQLQKLRILGKPILAGLSRKSTIYRTLQTDAAHALNGTTVLNTIALMNGAELLRVHDVKEAREAVILVNEYKNAATGNKKERS